MMYKNIFLICTILFALILVSFSAPVEESKDASNKSAKSAFGPAFDEIVVESSLTVKRKPGGRIAKKQNIDDKKIIKRQVTHQRRNQQPSNKNFADFSGSFANAQAQSFNSKSPIGSFGSSATGTQTQSLQFGPKGIFGSAGFAGTQQYQFNGQTIDIAFSGANSNKANSGGAAITITGPDGVKRPFKG